MYLKKCPEAQKHKKTRRKFKFTLHISKKNRAPEAVEKTGGKVWEKAEEV
tara:strand:- start:726 stop:875 length:150 start_codon:yes stop_codon:yes gene_type:complete